MTYPRTCSDSRHLSSWAAGEALTTWVPPLGNGTSRTRISADSDTDTASPRSTDGKIPIGRTSSIAASTASRTPPGPAQIAAGVSATSTVR